MSVLVFYLLVFFVVAVFFLFFHLMLGKLVRPNIPEEEKLTIYECGEPTVGSAWIQFDLRYYVVALLFVIFDVEVAFFFPWAVVFGNANKLADPNLDKQARIVASAELNPGNLPPIPRPTRNVKQNNAPQNTAAGIDAATAKGLGWISFFDILVFFGVLLVGFAYLWKRGDINWVRSMKSQDSTAAPVENANAPPDESRELAGVGTT